MIKKLDMSVLFKAIENHDSSAVAKLIEDGADPNAIMSEPPHWRPLHHAINELEEGGNAEVITTLLAHGAGVNEWDADKDVTPLLLAIFNDQLQVVDTLLKVGADPNVENSQGDSPLRVCVANGDAKTTLKLLRAGASKTINEWGGLLGYTPLGLAASRLDLSIIRMLLDAGANPNARDSDGKIAVERLPEPDAVNSVARSQAQAMLL
jgi:uncharacterized protein